ncbi:MAG: FAD-binding oxidoreductase [Woeseiaceae bacterium]
MFDELKEIVGPKGWTMDAMDLAPHLSERRSAVFGQTPIMLSPKTTKEVSAIVAHCAKAGVAIVPQGGNTGLCGGQIPDDSGEQILLSLSRLNRIRRVDADDFSMEVEAGCILADLQEAARNSNRLFPLSLGAEGSCQIGGNLSTNAGGINVIRYGTARQQVLGLEVVLADGEIWDGLRSLRKDTGGYDMKQVFVGSEGTLGIITAATLRLYPENVNTSTALVALESPAMAVRLLGRMRTACLDQVQAFELMSDTAMGMALRHGSDVASPFSDAYPWFVLVEAATSKDDSVFASELAAAIEEGQALDAVLAKNSNEAEKLWRIRHAIPESQGAEGVSLKHDISVPIGRIEEFMARAKEAVIGIAPDARIVAFGHVGDGNLHYNISQPIGADADAFRKIGEQASQLVYRLVDEMGGSFSAEHGVGVLKKSYLSQFRGGTELELMRRLKRALDPKNTLNPGKVI